MQSIYNLLKFAFFLIFFRYLFPDLPWTMMILDLGLSLKICEAPPPPPWVGPQVSPYWVLMASTSLPNRKGHFLKHTYGLPKLCSWLVKFWYFIILRFSIDIILRHLFGGKEEGWFLEFVFYRLKKSDFYHFGVWPPLESDKNIFYFLEAFPKK